MRILKSLAIFAALSASCFAQSFVVGDAGTVQPANNWPAGEAPNFAIDGVGQKYLNFGKFNTGFAITPAGGASTATSMTLWTANDAYGRDPASYELWGSNAEAPADFGAPGSSLPVSLFEPISVGELMLPGTTDTEFRNLGGDAALLAENSYTVDFTNDKAYSSYLVVFPTIKVETQNSMQIAEVQLFDAAGAGIFSPNDGIVGGQVVPEPASGLLAAFALLGCLCVRKRR